MIRFLTICTIGLGVALSGCTTYTTDECSSGDWTKIGLQDGRDGRTEDRFTQHGKACTLDRTDESRALYMTGRQKGLASYCTAVRGYREAALGQKYYGVCPPAAALEFSNGYRLGSRIHQLETKAGETNSAYFTVSRKLENSALPEAKRVELQREQARLQGDETRQRAELKQLRDKADAMVRASRSNKKKL